MKQRTLFIVVIIIAIALSGLIVIQAHWIRNAQELSRRQFAQHVNEALSYVVSKLEAKEAVFYVSNKIISFIADSNVVLSDVHSPHVPISTSREGIDVSTVNVDKNIISIKEDEKDSLSKKIGTKLIFHSGDTFRLQKIEQIIKLHDSSLLKADISKDLLKSINQKITDKQAFVEAVVYDIISKDVKIQDRINQLELNTLIKDALKNKGIDKHFEYAVRSGEKDYIIQTRNFEKNFPSEKYETKLFPNDIYFEPDYLVVYFPKKESIFIKSLGIVSLSSIALTLAIICGFALTIFIVIRQKKLSEIKSAFVNNLTHELKTPITSISLATQMLKDKTLAKNEETIVRYADIINDENERLGRQVETVLQMAILERKGVKLKMTELNIHKLIDEAIRKISIQVESRNGRIFTNFAATQTIIYGDETHITNVIYNLLDNANKYSPEKPLINVFTKNIKRGILISVQDNGIGINKEAQKKIFDMFYRVSTGDIHNVKGFGMGLSYVKTIIEKHKGYIKVNSEPNKGSRFDVFLPVSTKY